jgi:histone arginine demethylase JMJD6
MGWISELHNAKLRHRPKLKGNWERDGMHEAFPRYLERLEKETGGEDYQSFYVDEETVTKWKGQAIPAVLDAVSLTREDFYRYETEGIPAVLRSIPLGYDGGTFVGAWPAQEKWQLEALENDSRLLHRKFKCGEDDDEKTIRVKLKHFLSYTRQNQDDSPLYIFDSSFDGDRHYADRILRDYRVPSYFSDDLFRLVSESRRPPYRWWLIGPQRSGTCVHIDPLATSAWNTLIVGKKRWVLFPPHVPKSVVKGNGLVRDEEDDEAVHYFSFILPRIKRKATLMGGLPKYANFCCFEFTQNPGETVYVPHGWWHAVLNLTDTVAVTQNFCSPRNFDHVWIKTRTGRKRMAWKWLCALEKEYPELASRAKAMNKRDRFVMKYDPVEVEKRERAQRERRAESKRRKKERAAAGDGPRNHHRDGDSDGEDADHDASHRTCTSSSTTTRSVNDADEENDLMRSDVAKVSP